MQSSSCTSALSSPIAIFYRAAFEQGNNGIIGSFPEGTDAVLFVGLEPSLPTCSWIAKLSLYAIEKPVTPLTGGILLKNTPGDSERFWGLMGVVLGISKSVARVDESA